MWNLLLFVATPRTHCIVSHSFSINLFITPSSSFRYHSMWKGENHLIQHIERLIKKLFVSLLMSCVIVFPLNLRLIIESRCRASELASEREWCGVVWMGKKCEEWGMEKIDSNWELFSCCCSNAISRRPRDDDDNDEDIECEFCEELFHSFSLSTTCWLSWHCQACVCVCVWSH